MRQLLAISILLTAINANACGEVVLGELEYVSVEDYIKTQWINGILNQGPDNAYEGIKGEGVNKTACIIGLLNPAVDSKIIEEARKSANSEDVFKVGEFCAQIEKYSTLHNNQKPKSLDISGNNIHHEEDVKILAGVIEAFDSLEVINLSGSLSWLKNKRIEILIPAIEKQKNLQALNLEDNGEIDYLELKLIVEMAKNKKSLKKLGLSPDSSYGTSLDFSTKGRKLIQELKKARPDLEIIYSYDSDLEDDEG